MSKSNDSEKGLEVSDPDLVSVQNPDGTISSSKPDSLVSNHGDGQKRTIYGFKWFLVCISLYISGLIYGLDTTIAADIQSSVVESLGHVEKLTWLGTGFPLGSICAVLPAAALYSLFDMKIMFIGSIALFEVGSAVCGAAPTMNALVVGRVIAGVGGSGLYVGVLNYLSVCTAPKERGTYMAILGFVWGTGAILGPVIGGSFSTSSATWRWSFYINLVVAAICAPIYVVYLPSLKPVDVSSTVMPKLRRMDWIGIILSVGVMVTFAVAFTFAGTTWAWNDARTIVMIVIFGVLIAVLVSQQWFHIFTTPERRLFPPSRLLRSRSQLLLCMGIACSSTNLFLPLYYIPNYFQFVHGDDALMAAVRLLPFVIILIGTNLGIGILLPRVRIYAVLYLISGVFMTAGSSLMFTVKPTTPIANIYGYSVLIAIGSGLTINVGYAIVGIKASTKGGPPSDVQNVVSMMNLWQIGATLVSLIISGQVFQSYAFKNLHSVLEGEELTDSQIRSAISGIQSTVLQDLTPELASMAVQAVTDAISKTYILGIVVGIVGLLESLFMKWERLFGQPASPGGC